MLIKVLRNCFILIFIFIMIVIVIIIIMIIIMIMIIIFVMIVVMIIIIYIIKMETIFMNTEHSKTNESHRFRLDLTDQLNLKNPKKYGCS